MAKKASTKKSSKKGSTSPTAEELPKFRISAVKRLGRLPMADRIVDGEPQARSEAQAMSVEFPRCIIVVEPLNAAARKHIDTAHQLSNSGALVPCEA